MDRYCYTASKSDIRTREYYTRGVQHFEISLTSVKRHGLHDRIVGRISHQSESMHRNDKVFAASQYLQLNQIDAIN